MLTKKAIGTSIGLLLALGMGGSQAALVNYEIVGTVQLGDEQFVPNIFNLTAGETILASGVFDDSVLGAGLHTATFGSGNTLSIDVNGTIFTHQDDAGAGLTFEDGVLVDFSFMTGSFNSYLTYFDDFNFVVGSWGQVTTSPVPVPAAVWLFGSGLLGLVGVARRKK